MISLRQRWAPVESLEEAPDVMLAALFAAGKHIDGGPFLRGNPDAHGSFPAFASATGCQRWWTDPGSDCAVHAFASLGASGHAQFQTSRCRYQADAGIESDTSQVAGKHARGHPQ